MNDIVSAYLDIIAVLLIISSMLLSYGYWKKFTQSRKAYINIRYYLDNAEEDIRKRKAEEDKLYRRQRILDKIINCANKSLSDDKDFISSMKELAEELRNLFDSEYCSIGKCENGIVEDYVVSFDNYEDQYLSALQAESLGLVRRVDIRNENYKVCTALKSNEEISFFDDSELDITENRHYQIYADHILKSKTIKNTTIFPIRDSNGIYGYLQLINTQKRMAVDDIRPFKEALLQLIQLILRNKIREEELIKNKNLLKDTDFFRNIIEKKNDVDALFDAIMEYLSKEFNAAVITFRTPILNGFERHPMFYLRRCYVNKKVKDYKKLENHYYQMRFVKNTEEMGGSEYLQCVNLDTIIEDEAKDTDYYEEYNLKIKSKTFIVPIVRDNRANRCSNPVRKSHMICKLGDFQECVYRFEKLYGVFKLRIFNDSPDEDAEISVTELLERQKNKENKERLLYLSKQITILLNSLVEKYENESLLVFQENLKNSSFIKIKDFDQTCVEIIKSTVQAKACIIYRHDELNKRLRRSAISGGRFKKKTISLSDKDNILVRIYNGKCTRYDFQFEIEEYDSLKSEPTLFVPLIKKDNTCSGVIVVIGKQKAKHSISTVFWEHDKTHIEFIVDVLNRISESDVERLVFLQHLSHELLIPITNTVNDNDLIIETAERNKSSYTKDMLLSQLRSNLERNMLFKYIVSDVESIFSASNKTIQYNMTRCEHPKELLLDAIRLLEKDAHATKGLSIIPSISEMPPMILDKERIMQVFVNLLKNAIRYSYKNTNIQIFYKFQEGQHEIKFVNDGIGIPEADSKIIFELFRRSQNAKDVEVRGSGMGLYIVKGIMKAHGGDCVIRKLHQPTEISILFPNKL